MESLNFLKNIYDYNKLKTDCSKKQHKIEKLITEMNNQIIEMNEINEIIELRLSKIQKTVSKLKSKNEFPVLENSILSLTNSLSELKKNYVIFNEKDINDQNLNFRDENNSPKVFDVCDLRFSKETQFCFLLIHVLMY